MRRPFLFSAMLLMFALPASTNYELHDAGFGAGGTGISESGSYGITGIAGEVSGQAGVGSTYNVGPGLQFVRQSNVPAAPTLTNSENFYNRLHFVIDAGGNPADTVFAIAVSTDSFATTQYVQTDGTIGGNPVYQTYADWGGASGEYLVGLQPSTAYAIKVSAIQTKYTESAFSLPATAATTAPSLSFDIDVAATDSESAAPYVVALGQLSVGSVTTAAKKVWLDLESNAEGGGFVYLYGSGNGLTSAAANYTIPAVSGVLTGQGEGYGLRVDTVSESSGGPLTAVSPYNGTGETVGLVNTTTRTILHSSAEPITAGRASFLLKAITSTTTPAASDYAETLTIVASASF